MNQLKLFFLINLISFSVFSQQLELTQQDIETYRKLENGDFSNEFYLKAIIEQKVTDSSVVELQKKFGEGLDDMFCTGLIKSLIDKNHGGKYRNSHYFNRLKFEKFNDKYFFYESSSLYGNKELFIWGTYGTNKNEITIHSAVGHNLELMAYETSFKKINENDYIIFEADEQVAIIPMDKDTAITLSYNVDQFDKTGIYRKCILSCDTCIKCARLQHKGTSGQVKKEERVFTTELIIEDLDNDGSLDFYWFAVSNGELIKSEAFTPTANGLIPFDVELKELIMQTKKFNELRSLSLLSNKPGL
jgi:hypothetical protein